MKVLYTLLILLIPFVGYGQNLIEKLKNQAFNIKLYDESWQFHFGNNQHFETYKFSKKLNDYETISSNNFFEIKNNNLTFHLNCNKQCADENHILIIGSVDDNYFFNGNVISYSRVNEIQTVNFSLNNSNLNYELKKYVEKNINKWQAKDEFETSSDYFIRVNEQRRNEMIKYFQNEGIKILKKKFVKNLNILENLLIGKYDADNQTYSFQLKEFEFLMDINIESARKIKLFFNDKANLNLEFLSANNNNDEYIFNLADNSLRIKDVEFEIFNNKFVLSSIEFVLNKEIFNYNINDEYDFNESTVEYNFKEIQIENFNSKPLASKNHKTFSKIKVGSSEIDLKIPSNSKIKNKYAIIIGNENYSSYQKTLEREQDVPYAVNDASTFKKYALKTLGVEEDNLYFLENATSGQMNQTIDLVTKIVSKLGNKAELIFYYAGHGFPDELTKEPYLIPVDVSTSYLNNAISLDDLYDKFSKTGAKRLLAFVDACFSGGARENSLLVSRGVKINPKMTNISNNLVVFSASSETQSALPYEEQGHGMFTFYLLNKLKESSGKISLGELYDYISEEVSLNSLKINQAEQEPNVIFSPTIENKWRDWQLY